MLFQSFFVLVLVLTTCSGSFAQENLTSGTKPEPLLLERAAPLPPNVMRWIVPATMRSADTVGQRTWTPDGRRMFAELLSDRGRYVQCWKPVGAGNTLELEGRLKLMEDWALSPDGRWLFARCRTPRGVSPWTLYHADTLDGAWFLRTKAVDQDFIPRAAFSQDGQLLAMVHKEGGAFVISILDTATGSRQRVLRQPANAAPWQSASQILFSKDALLLSPEFDGENRVTRFPLNAWNPEYLTEAGESDRSRMVLSKDERWIVCWGDSGYEAYERTGFRYVRRFQGEEETRPGYVSGLQSVSMSADSTQLVISAVGKHKVMRLPSQAVLREGVYHCMCGEFSPDGKKFWKTCAPFVAVNTATWQELPEPVPGHHTEVHSVSFSPDGRRFASADQASAYVWPLADLARPQELVPGKPGRCLTSLAWQPDGREVWAGDSWSYLHWTLPVKTGPTPLPGKDGFPNQAQRDEPMRTQFLAPTDAPGSWLVSSDEGSFGGAEVRIPGKAARKLKNLSNLDFIGVVLVMSKDRKEVFYMSELKARAVNLTNDIVRNGTSRIIGDIVGIGGNPEQLVAMTQEKLTLVDAATLTPLAEIPAPTNTGYLVPSGGSKPAVSPDGRWLFCNVSHKSDSFDRLPALVDLASRKIAVVLPRLDADIHVAEFSPDSKLIVAGHRGGSVSLWNVASLATFTAN